MTDLPVPVAQSEQASAIRHRLGEGLAKIDPHHRLCGRPVAYRIIDGTTLEIAYRGRTAELVIPREAAPRSRVGRHHRDPAGLTGTAISRRNRGQTP